jgi:SAM-dependent methyltransferase
MITRSACPACGGALRPKFVAVCKGMEMPVSRCDGCGSYIKNPFFDGAELAALYAHYAQHESHYTPPPGEMDTLVEKVKRIEQYLPERGVLLEIGCGRGYMLLEARKRGWDARGLEIEGSARNNLLPGLADALTYVRSEEGFGVLEAGRYDAICSYQVFEHLLDPEAAFAQWSRALRPGGVLVVDTPNGGSLGARLHGPAWVHHATKEHFVLFTERALRGLCRAYGLDVVGVRYGGAPVVVSSSPTAARTARKVFRFTGLTRMVRAIVHRLGLGDNIELIARKK